MDEALLGRSRIFDGLTEAERGECLDAGRVIDVKRGQALARQGEPARAFYLVASGLLKLVQVTPEGHELIVRFVGAGEPFGGVVALAPTEYPVTALAVEATRLREWPRDALAALLDRYPQLRVNIMREMAAHMTDALTRVRELTTARVDQRLAQTLVRLSKQCGQAGTEGVLITQPLTRQELADLAGTTLYTVSRTLTKWESQGLIESRKRLLLLRSPEQLLQAAGADED